MDRDGECGFISPVHRAWGLPAGGFIPWLRDGQRVAMLKGSGSTGVSILLGDHLGSTSVMVNAETGSELGGTRYKPWGEQRSSWGTLPTKYRYTGQRLENFGLYFYQSRWYDPLLGRFAQADTIVPNPFYPASYDRYAYVRNSPVNLVDPSGHASRPSHDWECGPDGIYCWNGYLRAPDIVDKSKLSKKSDKILYSGEMMYELYLVTWHTDGWWWDYFGVEGNFTVDEFLVLILAYEFQPYGTLADQFIEDLKHAGTKNFWCSPNGEINDCTNLNNTGGSTDEAILNWLGGMQSGRMRYDAVFRDVYIQVCGYDLSCRTKRAFRQGQTNLDLAKIVAESMLHPSQEAIAAGWTNGRSGGYGEPWGWANKSLYPGWNPTVQGPRCTQYLQVYPGIDNRNPAFILSYCQVVYALQSAP
jgi:RHS repeat-associated protein